MTITEIGTGFILAKNGEIAAVFFVKCFQSKIYEKLRGKGRKINESRILTALFTENFKYPTCQTPPCFINSRIYLTLRIIVSLVIKNCSS